MMNIGGNDVSRRIKQDCLISDISLWVPFNVSKQSLIRQVFSQLQ